MEHQLDKAEGELTEATERNKKLQTDLDALNAELAEM